MRVAMSKSIFTKDGTAQGIDSLITALTPTQS